MRFLPSMVYRLSPIFAILIPMSELSIHTDGGARGNPGPAAIGVHIQGEGFERRVGKRIGETTNNVAEYTAVIEAVAELKSIIEDGNPAVSRFRFFLDSELVVRQLQGIYRVKEPTLQQLHQGVLASLRALGLPYEIVHVPRAQNKIADQLVNAALDAA